MYICFNYKNMKIIYNGTEIRDIMFWSIWYCKLVTNLLSQIWHLLGNFLFKCLHLFIQHQWDFFCVNVGVLTGHSGWAKPEQHLWCCVVDKFKWHQSNWSHLELSKMDIFLGVQSFFSQYTLNWHIINGLQKHNSVGLLVLSTTTQ